MQSAGTNISAERSAVLRFLEELADSPGLGPTNAMPSVQRLPGVGALPLRNAPRAREKPFNLALADSDGARAGAALSILTALGELAVQSIDTPFQAELASALQQDGTALVGSSNGALAEQGGLLQEESSAVTLGDAPTAQSFVASMSSITPPNQAGVPTAADQAWIAALQQSTSSLVASVVSAMSQSALAELGAWLGSFENTQTGTPGTQWIDSLLQSLPGAQSTSGWAAGNPAMTSWAGPALSTGSARPPAGGASLGGTLTEPMGAANQPLAPGLGSSQGGVLPGTH